MKRAEKQRQIEAGERVRCMVPFCQRTSKLSDDERARPEIEWQWVCGKHWRNVRPIYRRAHSQHRKKYGAANGSPFWRKCVEQAIARGCAT